MKTLDAVCAACGKSYRDRPERIGNPCFCSWGCRTSPQATIVRFFEKVNKLGPTEPHMDSNCWLWMGYRNKAGYGRMRAFGNLELCSRVSWHMHNGQIPGGLCVLHKCDSPPCVNPDHLFLGSYADNAKDRCAKGRSAQNAPTGESSKFAKLTEQDVLSIRDAYPRFTQQELANRFNVSRGNISCVVLRKSWRHLDF